MKMFTVWGVVLFCGFLGLSAGEDCMVGIGRLSKEKMQQATEQIIDTADIPGQIENMFKTKPEGKKPSALGQKSALSPSGMKCEFKEMPKVNITMGSDKTMNAKINMTLSMETSDGTMVDVDMFIILVCVPDQGAFKCKECSIQPGKEDIKISYVKGIPEPMKKMVDKMVKNQLLPPVYQNMCSMVQSALESPVADQLTETVKLPKDMNMKIENMEDKKTHFQYLIVMSKGGGQSKEGSCMSRTHTSWEPDCPMSEDALGDIAINHTDIEKHMKKMESRVIPMEGPEGEARSFSIKGVRMVESPEGPRMVYTPQYTSCKTEDPSECKSHSAGECSFHMNMAVDDNELKISTGSESCDQNTDPEPATDDHDSMCRKTNCKVADAMKAITVPVPGSMGAIADIKARNCKGQTVLSASIPLLDTLKE